MIRFVTVILAAGASSRMGRPKLLLPWHDKTILAHLIEQWKALGATQIGVVIETKSPLDAHLGGVDRIINPHPERGMFSSVQCAAKWKRWNSELTHFAITLGDQPQVGIQTLQAVINFSSENAEYICQPSRNGRPRHPVILPSLAFRALGHATENNLKEFLRAREPQRKLLELDDPGLDIDIDTPEDYHKALNTHPADNAVPSS